MEYQFLVTSVCSEMVASCRMFLASEPTERDPNSGATSAMQAEELDAAPTQEFKFADVIPASSHSGVPPVKLLFRIPHRISLYTFVN